MKVIVKDNYLNVRIGKPSVNAPSYQYIAPGSEIEVDGQLYKGDPYNDIDTWMKDAAGNYYWRGGVNMPDENAVGAKTDVPVPAPLNYNQLVQNIPANWRSTLGSGVTVAIVDTGLSNLITGNFSIKARYNPITKTSDVDDNASGHGSFVAGLIAANGTASSKVTGIAPLVDLIIVKASDSGFFGSNDAAFGIKWLLETCPIVPDIINFSCEFPAASNADYIADAFKKFAAKGTVIFAASGDNEALIQPSLVFPASSPDVVAVGSLKAPNTLTPPINPKVAYMASEQNFISLSNSGNDKYRSDFGSSFATAITTGIFALALSSHRASGSALSPLQYFKSQMPVMSPATFTNTIQILTK